MIVKICGITNREDALAAIDAGASALGFNFYPRSPRYLDPAAAAGWIAGLPRPVWKVGVFVNCPPGMVRRTLGDAGLDVAQLHGDEPPSAIPADLRVWKAFRVGPNFDPGLAGLYPVEAILLDAPAGPLYGGSGTTFPWLKALGVAGKIILAGGLDAANVAAAIREARPWGVDACSRLESSPGRKDHRKMSQFIRAAQAAIAS